MTSYADASAILERAQAIVSAAEGHGALCGLLSMNVAADQRPWLESVLDDMDESNVSVRESIQMLRGLYDDTREELNSAELEFAPLLPADEESLESRVGALGEWCHGFVYGLALGGITGHTELPKETAEIIRDITEISRVQLAVDENDENEDAYIHLLEFVRMGVLLINEQMQPYKPPMQVH